MRCSCERTCASAAVVISTRYGTSLTTSPSTSAAPDEWPTVATSGGTSKPVSHGETMRTIHPDGAITNARPIANAECGVARIGASQAAARGPHARPAAHAQKPNASRAEQIVAANPVASVSSTLVANPGHARSSRQASSENPFPPIAGR